MKKREVGWFAGFIKLRSDFISLQSILFLLLNRKDNDLNVPLIELFFNRIRRFLCILVSLMHPDRYLKIAATCEYNIDFETKPLFNFDCTLIQF